jgi:hypothetical protein
MPPVLWPLHNDRPMNEVELAPVTGGAGLPRRLVADTGAGSRRAVFQLILAQNDCLQVGGVSMGQLQLGGAYAGWFSLVLGGGPHPGVEFRRAGPRRRGVAGAPRL